MTQRVDKQIVTLLAIETELHLREIGREDRPGAPGLAAFARPGSGVAAPLAVGYPQFGRGGKSHFSQRKREVGHPRLAFSLSPPVRS